MKKLRIAASAVVLSAAFVPALATAQNVAMVNGKPVPKARLDMMIEQALKQGNQQRTPDMERQARDAVVMREIFAQEAERRGLQRSGDYKNQMELARQNILIRELFLDFQKKNPVTDADMQAEYDKYKSQAEDKEYRARHILVESEDEAKGLIAKLKEGAKFEELAKQSSKDPGSGQNGGDLDWAPAGNYVPEFSKAMVQLEKGKFTEAPVKSQFGWHIILLEDVRKPQFPSLDEVKPQLRQSLEQQKITKFQTDLRDKARTDYKFQ